ncbi:MAG: CHASE2 domain-containing protein, partial [Chitinivibrionales bacterium]|nr:CHASE2 domain-containing protein [Chitinivibrionales bacterium]
MDFLKKFLKSLAIGSLAGVAIALFTNFFFKDLIDALEYQTYYMRYHWQFMDQSGNKNAKEINDDDPICIIDIDDRSMSKMGMYWNWNRSYHAELIRNLEQHFPAALAFDILFYDPEDPNHAARFEKLLLRSREQNASINLSDQLCQAIISTIDYDRQFSEAVALAGNVFLGVRMSDKKDYPEYALSQVAHKMTMAW